MYLFGPLTNSSAVVDKQSFPQTGRGVLHCYVSREAVRSHYWLTAELRGAIIGQAYGAL